MALKKEELLKLRDKLIHLKNPQDIEEFLPKMSAYDYLYECNKDNLDDYALNYLGRKYTYRELFEKIDDFAKGLYINGVRSGDMVALGMLSTPEAIISFYALNKLGTTVYMINATHEPAGIREELQDSNAKCFITNKIFYDKTMQELVDQSNVQKVIVSSLNESFPNGFIGDRITFKLVEALKGFKGVSSKDDRCVSWSDILNQGKKSSIIVPKYYEENMGAVISSTSGSTGKPKRPLMTNENLNAIPTLMGMTCDTFAPNDSILTTLPIWILYTLFNSIHEPLCLGVTVDLDPLFNSKNVFKRLKQYRFNHWNTIPSYIEDMIAGKEIKGLDLSFLKSITTGGDYRTPKLKREGEDVLHRHNSDIEIGQGYGASECGGCFGYTFERGMKPESIGKPLFGNRYKIVDLDTGEVLGPNQSGEMYFYSPTMMKEYYGNEEATANALHKDENGTIWYKTEDVAHYDENGEIFLDGRLRRIEISRDSNGVPTKVFPDKAKQVISQHPKIEQCEIIMVNDEKRITRPVAYIVLSDGYVFDEQIVREINDLCVASGLESYIIPTEYKIIDSLPRTNSLKVDIKKLNEMYSQEMESKEQQKTLVMKN